MCRLVPILILVAASTGFAQTDGRPSPSAPVERLYLAAGTDVNLSSVAPAQRTTHEWVLWQSGEGFKVLHRMDSDEPGELYPAFEGKGRIAAVAGYGAELYIAYTGRSVQVIRFQPMPPPGPAEFPASRLPVLPEKTRRVELDVSSRGLYALVFVAEDEDVAGPVLRPLLLRQAGLEWEAIPLPDGLDPGRVLGFVTFDGPGGGPVIVAGTDRDAQHPEFIVHRLGTEGWSSEPYDVTPKPGTQRFVAATHQGVSNLLMIEATDSGIEVAWLRDGASRSIARLPVAPDPMWAAAASGEGVTIIAGAVDGGTSVVRVDFPPREEGSPTQWGTLAVGERPVEIDVFATVVVAAAVIGVMVLLMTNRRIPEPGHGKLPEGVQPAGVHRFAAAGVDFAPAVAGAMAFFGLTDPSEVFTHLVERPPKPEDLYPWLVAIALHVGHTSATEWLTGSTLGKAICGCRVIDLSGKPPKLWQVLVRNLFKALEMTLPLLLIFAVMSPTGQRIGDMVARTLVITPTHPKPDSKGPGEKSRSRDQ